MITLPTNREAYLGSKQSNDMWVVEAIWGHRIEPQPFSALMLEFLGIAEGMYREGQLFDPTRPNGKHVYTANRSLQLRNILFKNPGMEEILADSSNHDEDAWDTWLEEMADSAILGINQSTDFSYLRSRFQSFGELVSIVRLLRSIVVDPGSSRAWTAQFIFPIGPAALYEPVYETPGADKLDFNRRVFTRTGELAYLMLTRASEPLRTRIKDGLEPSLKPDGARNKLLLRLLEDGVPDLGNRKGGTYLPYIAHPAYDRMGSDIAALLELGMPNQDAFQYIQPLLGLHVYLYAIETANAWAGNADMPNIVCEILAPRSDLVRKAAISSYLDNDGLGLRAVRGYLESTVKENEELQAALDGDDIDDVEKMRQLGSFLQEKFSLDERLIDDGDNADAMLKAFYAHAERHYKTYTSAGLVGLAKGCGLVSQRGTNRSRYAPTDELLRCLVLANVSAPMEESAFLTLLFVRYRLVIGATEAGDVVPTSLFDESDFKRNRERFSQHLIGLGLARRMSDACTYIINPMEKRG
ncbi:MULTISPECIES: hypothetical protein [unclassified Janthinobacterium]|uniref:hypothetical protein n=1 Tax=unclassified Janthinobacterium TaxID=2610881 RepID=UPI001E617898|nr:MULTISPECIES: hypothetical protein [unclassified Janthinobacterium]MCC7643314.1 hypothetical protein [Janthinobacterium sp. EB271-G4-3-1]MCC7693801.1 hypothetical protein [Janthinobacterium sp. EB271-G4-3-2]